MKTVAAPINATSCYLTAQDSNHSQSYLTRGSNSREARFREFSIPLLLLG
jgi:hypothetical protein